MKKNILLGFSYFLLFSGFGMGYVSTEWSWLPLTLLGAGLLCLIIFCLDVFKNVHFNSSLAKQNWFAAGTIIFLSVFLISLNWTAKSRDIRFDLTQGQQHTLTDFTRQILSSLKQKINITVLYVGIPPKYMEDRLREYQAAGKGMVTTEVIDPLVDLGRAAQFGSMVKGDEKKVIVQSALVKKELDLASDDEMTEERLTNVVIQVSRPSKTVYFLSGHNEFDPKKSGDNGMDQFKTALENNNFIVKPLLLGISSAPIPDDCDVLVIAGPKEPLSFTEETAIEKYLEQGGRAFIMVEQVLVSTEDKPLTVEQLKKNPSLNSLLNPWGVKVGDDVVVDLASHASGDVGSPATKRYLPHKGIIHDLDYTFYLRPRSILPVQAIRSTIKTTPLVLTMSAQQSWGETNRYLKVKYDQDDQLGPVPIAFVIWEAQYGFKKSDTRIVLFTDADFLTDAYITYYSNMQMGLNVMNWLAETPYQVFYNKQAFNKVPKADMTSRQKKEVVLILLAIPFLIIILGVMARMGRG
ncbi:MAG: GldG family protein [Candidatus Omnitrophica bacterium]|nr:GldG family protein [Candidatus Omnitrophota bacterium]